MFYMSTVLGLNGDAGYKCLQRSRGALRVGEPSNSFGAFGEVKRGGAGDRAVGEILTVFHRRS